MAKIGDDAARFTRTKWQLLVIIALFVASAMLQQVGVSREVVTKLNINSTAAIVEDEEKKSHVVLTNNKRGGVAYISFGYLSPGSEWRFQNYVLDALETWLKDDIIYFVLNQKFQKELNASCTQPENVKTCQRIIPIFVDCPEGYFGPSPNCKMDQGMTAMWRYYPHYDWYSYQDDDIYVRTAYMRHFLQGLNPGKPTVLSSKPLAPLWSNCSKDQDYLYRWGQPAIYSRGALAVLGKGFAMGAVAKQSKVFSATHDVGNALVNWMYGLPVVTLPIITRVKSNFAPTPGSQSTFMGVHAVGRDGVPNMTLLHKIFCNLTYPLPPYQYEWHQPKGFQQSETYHLYGNPADWMTWHSFNASDCQGPVHPLSDIDL